jgi:hypothetical protein
MTVGERRTERILDDVWYKSIDQACTFCFIILSLSLSHTYNQSPWLPYITSRPPHTKQNQNVDHNRLFTNPPKCPLQISKPLSQSSLSSYSLSWSLRCLPTPKTRLQIPTSAECDVMQVLMLALIKWVSQFLLIPFTSSSLSHHRHYCTSLSHIHYTISRR